MFLILFSTIPSCLQHIFESWSCQVVEGVGLVSLWIIHITDNVLTVNWKLLNSFPCAMNISVMSAVMGINRFCCGKIILACIKDWEEHLVRWPFCPSGCCEKVYTCPSPLLWGALWNVCLSTEADLLLSSRKEWMRKILFLQSETKEFRLFQVMTYFYTSPWTIQRSLSNNGFLYFPSCFPFNLISSSSLPGI